MCWLQLVSQPLEGSPSPCFLLPDREGPGRDENKGCRGTSAGNGGVCSAASLRWGLLLPEHLNSQVREEKKSLEILRKWGKVILFKHFNMILILVPFTKMSYEH